MIYLLIVNTYSFMYKDCHIERISHMPVYCVFIRKPTKKLYINYNDPNSKKYIRLHHKRAWFVKINIFFASFNI